MKNNLACEVSNCVHFISGACSANKIHVSGMNASMTAETHCSTFQERNVQNVMTSLNNMNVSGEIKQFFSSTGMEMNPAIECDAKLCRYNTSGSCYANFVNIIGEDVQNDVQTFCETFEK